MKATAQAPANIAFVKYWGKSNHDLTLPNNSSISMNLAELYTTTTVDFDSNYTEDVVEIGFYGQSVQKVSGQKKQRVTDQLERLRKGAGITTAARVLSLNNFPADVGIASSASAFAALTAATCFALELKLSKKELSILTRLGGSGSATRSIPDGFTEWKKGTTSATSYAEQVAPPSHWNLADVVLVVSTENKKASSLEGHELASTSPYYSARLKELPARIRKVRNAIKEKDFTTLGVEIEKDALSLHFMAMTSSPPLWYWEASTVSVIKALYELRQNGVEAYFTIDAGPNVHLICEQHNTSKVEAYFSSQPYIQQIFVSNVGNGVRSSSVHLF